MPKINVPESNIDDEFAELTAIITVVSSANSSSMYPKVS